MISGRSTRKGGLGGKIRAPCILNRPIAPGNGYIRRGSCHSDLEKHTFWANIARKRAYFAHSVKREYIWCDSCQLGTRAPQCEGGGCRVLWAARRMMALRRARRDEPRYHAARGATDYSARPRDMAGAMDASGGSFLTVPGWCARRRRVVLLASSSLTVSGWSLQGMVAAGTVGCVRGEKKRPHMRPLYVKAISFERLYGRLERELRLSSSRRVPQSSSWGERIRGKLQEPWYQQRCGRSYGIPKP